MQNFQSMEWITTSLLPEIGIEDWNIFKSHGFEVGQEFLPKANLEFCYQKVAEINSWHFLRYSSKEFSRETCDLVLHTVGITVTTCMTPGTTKFPPNSQSLADPMVISAPNTCIKDLSLLNTHFHILFS